VLSGCAIDNPAFLPTASADGAAAIASLAKDLVPLAEISRGETFTLEPPQGPLGNTRLAETLMARLSAELQRRGMLAVAPGSERELLLSELALQLSDAFDADTTPEIGRWLGLRWTVRLGMAHVGDRILLSATAIDLETGLSRNANADFPSRGTEDWLLPLTPDPAATRYSARVGWTIEDPARRPLDENDFWSLEIRDGMLIRLELQTDRDVYALVYTVGSSGRGLVVFPHEARHDGYLPAGEQLTIPPEGLEPFKFVGEPGLETFWVVFSPRPLTRVPTLASLNKAPRLSLLNGRLDIQQSSFVSADKAGSWSAILNDLVDESHRSRGASELSAQLADGTPLPSIRFRDLGNAQVGDRRRTPTGLSRDAVLSAVGLTAVKFVVRHRP
jgi:hypothetical protein